MIPEVAPPRRRRNILVPVPVGAVLACLMTGITLAGEPATNDASATVGISADALVKQAAEDFANDKLDAALNETSLAIQLDPRNVQAYDQRSVIYMQQKMWDRAERDTLAEDRISPDVAYKYRLGEIKFLQKNYDDARPRFAALESDARLGDLSTYKTFLCDLFGGHERIATRDLAALHPVENKPSYLFCHAAWALYHGHRAEANQWFGQIHHAVDDQTAARYLASLLEVKRFQPPTATFTTVDGRKFEHAGVYLETGGLRASTSHGWVTLPLDQLPDDLSAFPVDLREQIARRRTTATVESAATSPLSFTTISGKTYDHVRWSLENTGLAVLTADGWITIPFGQLPVDSSAFPAEVRKAIVEKRTAAADTGPTDDMVSFTTKSGKAYNQVKTTLRDDGLTALTSDGLVTIPFHELPADLSVFPAAWREQIEARRNGGGPADAQEFLSFTTRDGRNYTEVRTTLEPTGLSVLTSQGLVDVPFAQLTSDLSPFPETWRTVIAARQNEMPKAGADMLSARVDSTADLYPPQARDCNFGTCLAIEGATLVVGGKGAAYVYANEHLIARLCPDPDSTHTGGAITSVAISGQTIVTGTSHSAFVWIRSKHDWTLQAALNLPGPATTVSLDGDNLLVIVDGKAEALNPIFYFARQGEIWQPVPVPPHQNNDTLSVDRFGCIAAVQAGEALIGVPDWSNASYLKGAAATSGWAFLERYDGKTWNAEATLAPDDAPTGANQFGASVALSEDFAAISSTNHDTIDYAPHHGSVYLFRHGIDGWKRDAVLHGPGDDAGFGSAPMALSHGTLAVGDETTPAHVGDIILDTGEKTRKAGSIKNTGAVYLFEGPALQATLIAPDPVESLNHLGSPDHFAASLALDGDILAVGAPGKNGGTGAVYLWRRHQDGWQLEAELKGHHQQADFDY